MSDYGRPAALSVGAFAGRDRAPRSPSKSPTKSPARPAGGALLRHSVDDVAYRQADSTRATDQATPAGGAPAADSPDVALPHSSTEKGSKYIQLLSAYSPPSGHKPRSTAAAASSTGGDRPQQRQQLPSLAPLAAVDGPTPPPLRTSASPKGVSGGLAGKSASTTPSLRRSVRASILDSSQSGGSSLIPASPEGAAHASSSGIRPPALGGPGAGGGRGLPTAQVATSPVSRLRSSTGSATGPSSRQALPAREHASPVRRSAPSAQARPAYAFGSRLEPPAAAKRRPSPTRAGSPAAGSGGMAQGDRVGRLRAAASPQRVPAAARASAPAAGSTAAAGYRSASAPRMSSADKAQSRFTQHALSAAAAQRSKTPNPAQRAAAAAAAAAATSSAAAARRLRHSTQAADKHVARMRASDPSLSGPQHSRLPGFSSTSMGLRSPTKAAAAGHHPMLRPGSRSVLAGSPAAGPGTRASMGGAGSRAIPAAPGNRPKPLVRSVDRLSLPGAGSIAADAAAASQEGPPMLKFIQCRYKDLYKHTPAAQAVEEARAAAAAGLHAPAAHSRPSAGGAVPRLALGGLARQGSGEPIAAPRGPSQQQHQHEQVAGEGGSPFLGRMSGMAAGPAGGSASLDKPGSFSTPQPQRKPVVPLLALSTITPVAKSRPAAAAAPRQDETPSLLVKSQPRTDVSSNGSSKGGRPGQDEELASPQLAPRDLSSGMLAADGSSACAAGQSRGFAVPGLQLHAPAADAADGHFDSPPKHRRGERESPSSSADTGSHGTLKTKVQNLRSTASSSSSSAAVRSGPQQAVSKPAAVGAKPRQRVGGAAAVGSVLEAAAEPGRKAIGPPARRSIASGIPSPTASTPAHGLGGRPQLQTPGSQFGKTTPLPSPSSTKKLPTPVPRLDLTPVLASLAAESEEAASTEGQGHNGMLLLEDAPRPRRLELDDDSDKDPSQPHSGARQSSGKQGHAGPGSGKGKGSGKQCSGSGKKAAGPGSKGGQASAEPPPQESFYVYESVMPPEEQKTYEELRRVLQKAPGGSKHVANLQGIWGCYQDARRNTEAMAFRGHRLLDQVSTEYSSFKREAEVKMEELQHERDQAREELQLAMVAGSVPATALQLAAKDREVRELQEENSLLRQQVTEMEKALQMASDYHAATQAAHQEQQVPVHARVIAGSATTSILTNQVVQQQYELQKVEKRVEDMKAALHLACGVLRQTNYMDQESGLRTHLDPDTLTVLDAIMATEEMEAVAMQQEQVTLNEPAAPPAVHIEEVHEHAELDAGASAAAEPMN